MRSGNLDIALHLLQSQSLQIFTFTFFLRRNKKRTRVITLLSYHPHVSRYHVSPNHNRYTVNTGTGRARVVSVYVLTPRVSIVSHFDEFGNNQWLGRAPGITTLISAARDMLGYLGAREPQRISVKIFIIIQHLTNNDHY